MPIIQIEHLSKAFGCKKVLDDISLDVEKGDIYGVLGLSGAGKSTLVRCINGLETFDEGRILYKGEVLADSKKRIKRSKRRQIAMIFQDFNLLDQKTVLENRAARHGTRRLYCQYFHILYLSTITQRWRTVILR